MHKFGRSIVPGMFALPLLALSLLSACGGEGGDQGQRQMPPPEVLVHIVKTQSRPATIDLPGRANAYLTAEVRPQVSGILKKRLFQEGQDVEAGQVLYEIDPATYQAALARAAAALAQAKANLRSADLKADRYAQLVKNQNVSQAAYDDAAAAQAGAKAAVSEAEAALNSAQIDFDYTKVRAPIGGRIGKSTVTPGSLLSAYQQQSLATIQQLDPIYVDLNQSVEEHQAFKRKLRAGNITLQEGQPIPVRLRFEDGRYYGQEGTLSFADVTVDRDTGTITLRAKFPNSDFDILPGMFVRAVVEAGVNPDAMLVPQQGIVRNPQGQAVAMVVNKDDVIEPHVVNVSEAVDHMWLVESGLDDGDRVVIEGLQKIQPGAKVKVVTEAEQESSPPPGSGGGQ